MPYDDSDVKKMIKYQTERKVGFSRHKKICQNVKDLIHSILEANVERRYTIQDIKRSLWMTTIPPSASQPQQPQPQPQSPATDLPRSNSSAKQSTSPGIESVSRASSGHRSPPTAENHVHATLVDNPGGNSGNSGTSRPETPLRTSNLLPLEAFRDADATATGSAAKLHQAAGFTPLAYSRLDVERSALKRSSLIVESHPVSTRDRVRGHGRWPR